MHFKFSQKGGLNTHIESVHAGKKPFKCKICDASFYLKRHLNGHIESVHEGKKPFKCNICDACFFLKGKLKGHIESVHEGNICVTSVSIKGTLNAH